MLIDEKMYSFIFIKFRRRDVVAQNTRYRLDKREITSVPMRHGGHNIGSEKGCSYSFFCMTEVVSLFL